MERLDRIEGPNLALRLITPDDAAYIHSLRIDSTYNRYLSEVRGTASDQRRWIESYKLREAEGQEFYFIIERRDGQRCGVVRLYDIATPIAGSFTWGSWILDRNKPPKAALESACLVYSIAFERLGLQRAVFEVRRNNERTLAFHRRFGAQETHSDEHHVFFVYLRTLFEIDRAAHLSAIQDAAHKLGL